MFDQCWAIVDIGQTLGRCVVLAGLFITLQCLRIILILPNQRRHYDCDLARFQVRFVFHRPPH